MILYKDGAETHFDPVSPRENPVNAAPHFHFIYRTRRCCVWCCVWIYIGSILGLYSVLSIPPIHGVCPFEWTHLWNTHVLCWNRSNGIDLYPIQSGHSKDSVLFISTCIQWNRSIQYIDGAKRLWFWGLADFCVLRGIGGRRRALTGAG